MFVYLLILLIGGVASFFAPWWVIAPISFAICGWRSRSPQRAFWAAASASITLWWGYTVYLYRLAQGDMADQVIQLFSKGLPVLQKVPGIVLICILAALIIGLVGGFSGLAGERIKALRR